MLFKRKKLISSIKAKKDLSILLEKYKKSPRLLQKIPPKLNSFIFISLYISLYILSVDDNDTLCLCLKEKIDPLPPKKK